MSQTMQSLKNKSSKQNIEPTKQHYTNWKKDEIIALIAAVEVRPELWDKEISSSQKPAKGPHWTEVYLEMKSKGFDIDQNELKMKWLSIRSNLMTSIKNKKGFPKWEKYLSFMIEHRNSTTTDKVSKVSPALKRKSARAAAASVGVSSTPALDPYLDESQPKLILNRVSSSTLGVPTTSEFNLNTSDPNLTLCKYLLAELRMLSDLESIHLRGMLMKVVYDFGETLEVQSTRKSNFY